MGKNNQAKRKLKKKKRDAKEAKRVARLAVANQPRSCNGCNVCCTVFGVEEIDKGPYEPCEHVCEAGCSIYQERPNHCKGFYCLWQMGLGTMDQRPDKLRVVFSPTTKKTEFTGEEEIQAYEVDPGAFDNYEAIAICRRLVDNNALIIGHVHGPNRKFRLMGQPEKTRKAHSFFSQHNVSVKNPGAGG